MKNHRKKMAKLYHRHHGNWRPRFLWRRVFEEMAQDFAEGARAIWGFKRDA